jgi:signal transduction histidine kinase
MTVHTTGQAQQREWELVPGKTYQLFEYPFMDEDGTPQVLKLGIDISDRKIAEEALVKARDELEMRVTERTAELQELIRMLNNEIHERRRVEQALMQSEGELRRLSARLLSAQEEERKLIAMELHDSIGGALSAVKFSVENSLTQLSGQSAHLDLNTLKSVIPIVQNAIDEVRRIHSGIWPSILEDLGVLMAIRWFLRQYGATYPQIGIETEFGLDEEDIPEHLKIVIYRIMQEAFNNIGKHSGASAANLSLTRSNEAIELTIQDNGHGFDIEARSGPSEGGGGLGLSSMKERTKLSGGAYEIYSDAQNGTSIKAAWTLPDISRQVA